MRTITAIELHKKHAGSLLGILWFPVYSGLFLGVYSFVYLKLFQGRSGSFGPFGLVLFIFTGLVPYLGLSEAVSASTMSIRMNITIVKNTLFPAELVPMKHVLVALSGMMVSVSVLIGLVLLSPFHGWHLLYLPVPMLMLLLFSLGVAWFVAALAVLIPDILPIVNLGLLLVLFVSPIGYALRQVSGAAAIVLYANPMTYLIDSFRFALLGLRDTPAWVDAPFAVVCLLVAAVGGTVFRLLKAVLADYV